MKKITVLSLSLTLLLCLLSCVLTGKASAMKIKAETYIVIPKNNKGDLQSLTIKRAIGLSLKKAVKILIGRKKFSNKKNSRILEKEIYSKGLKYVYSFKIVKSKKYLNLYYIDLIVYIRENDLKAELRNLGFKIVDAAVKENKINYNVYYVKFTGNFSYSDSNRFQKLMLKYSRHLQNLYVSSFSEDFAEIKVLYYGSIIRLFKRVKTIIETYLKAKIYPVKNNTIIVDVK